MMKGGRSRDVRIKEILKETILALLNNGVEFTSELQVDGLLGVTVDQNDVFLVRINEIVPSLKRQLGGHDSEPHHGDSSEEETAPKSAPPQQSKAQRRKRRSPSPKQSASGKNEKRARTTSPTQAIPSSTSTKDVKSEGGTDYGAVDIDLTNVKMEPVDTTVADSNNSGDFDFSNRQQLNHPAVITSIQSVAESEWQGGQQQQQQQQQEMANAQLQQQIHYPQLLFDSITNDPTHGNPSAGPCTLSSVTPIQHRRRYTQQQLDAGMADVLFNNMSGQQAARKHGVPQKTLSRYVLKARGNDHIIANLASAFGDYGSFLNQSDNMLNLNASGDSMNNSNVFPGMSDVMNVNSEHRTRSSSAHDDISGYTSTSNQDAKAHRQTNSVRRDDLGGYTNTSSASKQDTKVPAYTDSVPTSLPDTVQADARILTPPSQQTSQEITATSHQNQQSSPETSSDDPVVILDD